MDPSCDIALKYLKTLAEPVQVNVLWTKEEKQKYLEALTMYRKDFQAIFNHVSTKGFDQVKSYSEHLVKKFEENPMLEGADKVYLEILREPMS